LSQSEINDKITDFLFSNRNTPCSVTGKTPAQLFLNCSPITLLDQLKPPVDKFASTINNKKNFPGDKVYVKTTGFKDINWENGEIIQKNSPFMYKVVVNNNNIQRICHTEQLRSSFDSREGGIRTLNGPRLEFESQESISYS
jgi:hypothetical protein